MSKKRRSNFNASNGTSESKPLKTTKGGVPKCEVEQWSKGRAIAPLYKSNDGTWYTMGATLSPNILNWNTKLSNPGPWDLNPNALGTLLSTQRQETPTPGIMVLYFVPVIGKCQDFNDAMNVAARGLHAYIWHKATRTTSYDPADLMIYCGLADSLNAFYGLMCRLYGLLSTYGYTNAYYPEAAIYAQGFDPVDLRNHMPAFRTYINMYARKLGRYAVPASIPIFKRHNYLCSNVFKDDDDPDMFQTYIPMPEGFYKFDTDQNGWGMMKWVPLNSIGTPPYTFSQLMAYGDDLINSWAFNTDLDAMSADVLQALGPENCWSCATIGEDYVTTPTFDENFMMQVDNMDFLGAVSSSGQFDVTQTLKGVVTQTPLYESAELYPAMPSNGVPLGEPLYTRKSIIWNKPTTTLEEVMELTRGVSFPVLQGGTSTTVILEPAYSSTENWTVMKIVNDLDIDPAAPNAFWHSYQGTGFINMVFGSGGTVGAAYPQYYWMCLMNSFKHHPACRVVGKTSSAQSSTIAVGPDNRDLRHWAGLTIDQMRQINEQAVFSEWNVAKSNFVIS